MRISDWSSDVCSSDLVRHHALYRADDDDRAQFDAAAIGAARADPDDRCADDEGPDGAAPDRRRGDFAGGGADRSVARRPRRPAGSEERRVGKEWVRKWRYRWSRYH